MLTLRPAALPWFWADLNEDKMINPAPGFWPIFDPLGPTAGPGSSGNGLGWPEIVDFWGLGGPGGPKPFPTGVPRSGPLVGRCFGATGAAQTTKISDFRSTPKPCIKSFGISRS